MTHFPAALAAAAAAAEASPPDEAADAAAAAAADPGPAKHSGNTIIVQTTYTEHTAGLKVFGECTLMLRDSQHGSIPIGNTEETAGKKMFGE